MLRLMNNQTGQNAILVDDIDCGLPNLTAHRTDNANPATYSRDGYANAPKQPCYVPYSDPLNTSLPGYIDLYETERVSLSAGKGKIQGLSRAGFITVTQFQPSDIIQPTVTHAALDGSGNLTITGTTLVSLAPDFTSVVITGTGAVTLTQTQILAAVGGSIIPTSIVIPASLDPTLGGWASGTTYIVVNANAQTSKPSVAIS